MSPIRPDNILTVDYTAFESIGWLDVKVGDLYPLHLVYTGEKTHPAERIGQRVDPKHPRLAIPPFYQRDLVQHFAKPRFVSNFDVPDDETIDLDFEEFKRDDFQPYMVGLRGLGITLPPSRFRVSETTLHEEDKSWGLVCFEPPTVIREPLPRRTVCHSLSKRTLPQPGLKRNSREPRRKSTSR